MDPSAESHGIVFLRQAVYVEFTIVCFMYLRSLRIIKT